METEKSEEIEKPKSKSNFAVNEEVKKKAQRNSHTPEAEAKRKASLAIYAATGISKKALKQQAYEAIRNKLLETKRTSSETYLDKYINKFLNTALADMESNPAKLLSNMIFKSDLIDSIDMDAKKAQDNDIDYKKYLIRTTLYDKQMEVYDDEISKGMIIINSRRSGKCWGKGTKLRLYNGTIKNVEDIKVGDILIDEKSSPTEVISLAHGKDIMYKVSANVDNAKLSFICNSAHILTVMRTASKWRSYETNKVYDIPLQEFILFPKDEQEHFSLYRARTEYASNTHTIDPYIIGLWLGDGNKNDAQICVNKDDEDIRDFLEENYRVSIYEDKRSKALSYNLRGYKDKLRKLNLLGNKHIPVSYKIDSIDNRLKLLAGLIDSDGYKSKSNNSIEISSSNKVLADDIFELCCSLGFRVLIREKQAKLYGIPKKLNYIITIKGNLEDIPNVLKRKHANNSKQRPVYGFNITELQEDEYFGFTLNGNGRCLLADYTVTHNTELLGRLIVKGLLKPDAHVVYINRTSSAAKRQIRGPLQTALDKINLKCIKGSVDNQEMHFENGSQLLIIGQNNSADTDKLRGERISLCLCDECGHTRNIRELIREVISPALRDYADSQLVMVGTPPRIPHTYIEELWNNPDVSYKKYHWTFESNPFIPNRETVIEDVCKEFGVAPDSPFIQREYLGIIGIYDRDCIVFKNPTTHDKVPQQPTWYRAYIGVDFGFADDMAVISGVVDKLNKKLYIVDEWHKNRCSVADVATEVKRQYDNLKNGVYGTIATDTYVITDTNEKSISFELMQQYKIPNVFCAYKYDKLGAIDQLATWMRVGNVSIPKGGYLHNETELTIWQRDEETDKIIPELDDDTYHANGLMALLYISRQFAFEIMGTETITLKSVLE